MQQDPAVRPPRDSFGSYGSYGSMIPIINDGSSGDLVVSQRGSVSEETGILHSTTCWGGSKKFCIKWMRTAANISVALAIIPMVYSLYCIYSSDDPEKKYLEKTLTYLGIGFVKRVLAQANLPPALMRPLHNIMARWSWETYLIFGELLYNISSEAFPDVIAVLLGWHVVGNTFEALRLTRGEGQNPDVLLQAGVQNKMFIPRHDFLKTQIPWEVAQTAAGVFLTTYGNLDPQPASLAPLYKSGGYFFLTKSSGKFLMKALVHYWEKSERSGPNLNEVFESIKPRKRLWKKCVDMALFLIPYGVPYLIAASLFVHKAWIFAPIGFFYGGVEYLKEREFQNLTQEVFDSRKGKNLASNDDWGDGLFARLKPCVDAPFKGLNSCLDACCPKLNSFLKTAIKSDRAASVIWVLGATGYSIAIIVVDGSADRKLISAFLTSEIVTTGLATIAAIKFLPGVSNRLINTLRYFFIENPLLFSIAVLSLQEVTRLDDETLSKDATAEYYVGLAAYVPYASLLISNRIRNIGDTRSNPAFTPPVYDMYALKTTLEYATGYLSKAYNI